MEAKKFYRLATRNGRAPTASAYDAVRQVTVNQHGAAAHADRQFVLSRTKSQGNTED